MNNENIALETRVRTPGKCLITGGYLILNPNKKGLVINVDAYFEVKSIIEDDFVSERKSSQISICVTSLYLKEQYSYLVELNASITKVSQVNKVNCNKWIENSIKASFYSFLCLNNHIDINHLLSKLSCKCISIIIDSDYRFFSYDTDNTNKDIKTGLGSSSALIVSLCSNLIALLYKLTNSSALIEAKSINDIDKDIQSVITYACILSNNLSQNKIGSGFDLMACLFGHQIFHQCKLSLPPFDSFQLRKEIIEETQKYLKEIKDQYLSQLCLIEPIPSLFQSALISIEHGSDTRIMVKNVLSWAETNKQNEIFDDKLFTQLDIINNKIIQLLSKELFTVALSVQMQLFMEKVGTLKQLCVEYRNQLKLISKETKVDIEPLVLSPLLDDLIKSNHIAYAICPGAGGFDSIFVLGVEEEDDIFYKEIANSLTNFNLYNKDTIFKAYVIKSSIGSKGTQFLK